MKNGKSQLKCQSIRFVTDTTAIIYLSPNDSNRKIYVQKKIALNQITWQVHGTPHTLSNSTYISVHSMENSCESRFLFVRYRKKRFNNRYAVQGTTMFNDCDSIGFSYKSIIDKSNKTKNIMCHIILLNEFCLGWSLIGISDYC